MGPTQRKTVLFADFFGSVKERGIAAYVRDLEALCEPMADTIMLRAPAWVARRSPSVQNLLLVLHEQLFVPLYAAWRRPDLIVYPYNASSFVLALSRRTVCVVHDLIPYQARTRRSRFALAYVACTARWHGALGRRLVAVSPFTARAMRTLPRFRSRPILVIPNSFASLRGASVAEGPPTRRRVTLISGSGPNKAFARAVALMAEAASDPRFAGLGFDVVGFGDDHAMAEAIVAAARAGAMALPPITVHPLLPREALDRLIADNAAMWAHSLAEGFGRAVVEGRMAGRPVVMSRLPVFRPLADAYTFAYHNGDGAEFRDALATALDASAEPRPYRIVDALRAEAVAGLRELLDR